jgi:hypothetical protein
VELLVYSNFARKEHVIMDVAAASEKKKLIILTTGRRDNCCSKI